MSSCTDFVEEESMLQSIANDLGARVDRTPKCHCKLAREGIEYAWACSKNKYCLILLENRRGKEKFINTVRLCISRHHITREHAQKFAKQARRYIMGYHVLHQQQHNEAQDSSSCSNEVIVPIKLEQMVKQFKMHRWRSWFWLLLLQGSIQRHSTSILSTHHYNSNYNYY